MIVRWTDRFTQAYEKLPLEIQKRFDEKIKLFKSNPKHPSLNTHRVKKTSDIWEAYVTKSYRWTFQFIRGGVKLRVIGTHGILRNP